MDSANYGDIIFFAIVAVYLAIKLSSTLGKRSEGDDNVPNIGSLKARLAENPNTRVERVVEEEVKRDFREEVKDFEFSSDKVKNTVEKILNKDRGLSLAQFANGAKGAFDMVLKAFSEGDKTTLKGLLSASLYKDLVKKLDDFSKKDLTPVKSLISIKVKQISGAKLSENLANITLKFTTEQINFVKDESDKIVDGDSSFIESVEDEWSFERNLKSSNPNWQIVAI